MIVREQGPKRVSPRITLPVIHVDARQGHAADTGAQSSLLHDKEKVMHALKDLFTSDVGLMAVAGLTFMLGMGVFFVRYFFKHMREDGERAAKLKV